MISLFLLFLSLTAAIDLPPEIFEKVAGRNNHKLCCFWAYIGECDKNPDYMTIYCQFSCGTLGCNPRHPERCKVKVSKFCGGTWNPFQVFNNNYEEARLFWTEKQVQLAFENPAGAGGGEKISNDTRKFFHHSRQKRQLIPPTEIQEDFPDGYVKIMPDRDPYSSRVGAVVYQNAAGINSLCSGALVNVGTEEKPVVVVFTAAHCVVVDKPVDCYSTPWSCDKDCNRLEDDCLVGQATNIQFRLNERGTDLSTVKDIKSVHVLKGQCFKLCRDFINKFQADWTTDWAMLELVHPVEEEQSFPLRTQISPWATTLGYTETACTAAWTWENEDKLPEVFNADEPDTCWGNLYLHLPIGIGAGISEDVEPNDFAYDQAGLNFDVISVGRYHASSPNPMFHGHSGGPWVSEEGAVVGVNNWSFDSAAVYYTAKLDTEEFAHLRQEVVQSHRNGGGDRTTPKPPEPPIDSHPSCCEWAKVGECDNNPFWMRVNCQKSCGTPGCRVQKALRCRVNLDVSDCGSTPPTPPSPYV